MTLFIISIPLMALAVALAVLPLVFMSIAEHHRTVEATVSDTDLPANVAVSQDPELSQAA